MNYDEFAFFNQQLAAMVRDGIPLEGAMQRLTTEMSDGPLRRELAELGADLAKGTPLREAIQQRKLPDLYRQMLEVGAQTNDLSGVLTLLADHYQRRQLIWTRLKGLMVYPTIVLFAALLLSCFFSYLIYNLITQSGIRNNFFWNPMPLSSSVFIGIWLPPLLLAVAVVAVIMAWTLPAFRRFLRWRLPAFKEANLAQIASALALMLKSGVPLDKALALAEKLENGNSAGSELATWRQQLAAGIGKFSHFAAGGHIFPPLFRWIVGQSGEDLPSGFERAAEVYQARASYRIETLLYAAMPFAILVLAVIILLGMQPVISMFVTFFNAMFNMEG